MMWVWGLAVAFYAAIIVLALASGDNDDDVEGDW